MKNGEYTTKIRAGKVGDTNVKFTVTANFNNGVVATGTEGHFIEPENAYHLFSGANASLLDIETNITYELFVSNNRFSFHRGYENVDKLFN